MDGIIHPAGSTVEFPFENLFCVFLLDPEGEVALTDRATKDIHE
jgi:hypothetical protein